MKTNKKDETEQAPKEQQLIDRHPLHPDKKLVTRRDFLSSGLIGFSGAMMLPSLANLVFLERAAAAGITPSANPYGNMMPFVVLDLAGGASHPLLMAGGEGLQGPLLSSYSRLGYADNSFWDPDYRFGAPFPKPNPLIVNPTILSETFEVLVNPNLNNDPMQPNPDVLPQSIQDNLRIGVFAHTSLSDSAMNPLSAVSLVTAAGLQGTRIKSGLGTNVSPSAGNSEAASLDPSFRPMGIRSVDGLTSALSYGPAFSGLPTKLKEAVARGLNRLNENQGRRLATLSLGQQFAALMGSAFSKNAQYVSDQGGIDPRQDASIAGIYGLNAGSNAAGRDTVIATLVKNTLDGNSGPAVITIGGCDYHDGTATTGAAKNTEIGRELSRLFRAAAAKNKPLAVQIFTDGGISSDDGTRVWRGDDNDKSFTIMMVYDPAGPREMVSHQVGTYTDGQGADRKHYLGTDPQRVAHAVFLNYLALHGQSDRYAEVAVGRNKILQDDQLKKLLLFKNSG